MNRSAKGAKYESQGQARREAERVAPGNKIKKVPSPERAEYLMGISFVP